MRDTGSPSLRLRRLASELRRHRQAAGYTVTGTAKELGWSPPKVSKMETTETKRIAPSDLNLLLDLYKVTDPAVREAMQALARDARERGWWSKYREVFGNRALPDFEAEASVIRTYEAQMIPGLLQTPEYTKALLNGGRYVSPEGVDRKVEARMARRDILHKVRPARLRVLIDEGALHRRIGNDDIMRGQLENLLYMAQWPNIDMQVLPFSAGSHAALVAPFTILEFSEPLDLPIVYVGTATDGLFLEEPNDVEEHSATFGDAQGSAMSTAKSAKFVSDLLTSLEVAS